MLTNTPVFAGLALNNGFFHTSQGLSLKSTAQFGTIETNLAVVCGPFKSTDLHPLLQLYFYSVYYSASLCARNTVVNLGNFRKVSSVLLACDISLTRSCLNIIGKSDPNKYEGYFLTHIG